MENKKELIIETIVPNTSGTTCPPGNITSATYSQTNIGGGNCTCNGNNSSGRVRTWRDNNNNLASPTNQTGPFTCK